MFLRGLPLIKYAPREGGGGGSSLLYISIVYYMQKGGGVQIACKMAYVIDGRPLIWRMSDSDCTLCFPDGNAPSSLVTDVSVSPNNVCLYPNNACRIEEMILSHVPYLLYKDALVSYYNKNMSF